MLRLLAVFFCSAFAVAAPPSLAMAQGSTAELGKGRVLVTERCGGCHAILPSRVSQHGDAPPFAEIVKRYPPEALAEALAEGIEVGHPDMPTFEFSEEEVLQIVEYLKSLE
jgi:cytochrome c